MGKKPKVKKGKRYPYVSRYKRLKLRKWFREYKKDMVCYKCGESHIACIEFHHLDPKKKDSTIHHLIRIGAPLKVIMRELQKCKPICCNCHKKEHWDGKTTQD